MVLLSVALLLLSGLGGLEPNQIDLGGLDLILDVHATARIGEYTYPPLAFSVSSTTWPDSSVILYSAPELDLTLTISPTGQFYHNAWQFSARADFKQEVYLRELYKIYIDKP
ncbi:MAG: hypothetical protein K0B87_07880 [Candidatus Syntrophosphaera sp.]|nr:hypothetical protein [Candidatus Syntrophosphaera sp.]